MIAILLSSPGIDTGSEQVAIFHRTEPRSLVSRRQSDRIQSVDFLAIRHPLTFMVEIAPSAARTSSGQTRQAVIHENQTRFHCMHPSG